MMDPAAANTARDRYCRLARRMTWVQCGISVLMAIGVIGDFRKEWVVLVYLAVMACSAVHLLAMYKAQRLLDAQLAELGETVGPEKKGAS